VLLDLGLPDSEGIETLNRFVAVHGTLPVVVLTGHDDNDLGRRIVQSGAQDYLPKGSVHPSLLNRTVRHAIERARISNALVDARSQLVRAQRLDAFGQLASGMAHDFNNLLAVISTTAELAVQRDGVDPMLSEDLSDILEASERGTRLVSQLLTFARRRPGRPEQVPLARQVHALQRILRRTIGADIHLEIDIPSPELAVRIDPGLLDQVLLNLVVNARDAMPSGGRIVIRAAQVAGGMVELQVEDSGVGMTPEQRRRAIEPFYSTKSTGNGLGLSMCFGIIEQAGGQFEVQSTPGQGTTIVIRLPFHVGEAVSRRVHRRRPAKANLRGLRVLLVEDLSSLRRVLRRVLRRAGVVVSEAADGPAAMDSFRAPDLYDVAVLDITLPMMSGLELSEALLELAPSLPVILMTGGGVPPGETLAANVVDVLEKPFSPEALLDLIDRARSRAHESPSTGS